MLLGGICLKRNQLYNRLRTVLLVLVLAGCFCVIAFLNFSAAPSFYDADMYCDYRYAMETWKHRSIFPDGWVFGNQLNVVSTPVLAALFYGFTGSPNFAMAAASTIMAVLLTVSYDWMMKPVLKEPESRLLAIILLITVSLYCGKAVHGNQGWTLLFTMCTYYAGYSITAFLAFGCYLRSLFCWSKKDNYLLLLTWLFSFGTGIQSIRQTAIMIVPILAVEFFRMLVCISDWKANRKPLWVALGITIFNILGLVYIRIFPVNQHPVFGTIEIVHLQDLGWSIQNSFSMIQDLLKAGYPEDLLVLTVLVVLCVVAFLWMLKDCRKEAGIIVLVLTLLLSFSVLVIVAINFLTTMYIRPRYYFMLYPLFGLLFAYGYTRGDKYIRNGGLALLILFLSIACVRNLPDVCTSAIRQKEEKSHEISSYLQERGYTTIYATWWLGQDIAVASNGEIEVGYWYTEDRPFEAVPYLCNLDLYDASPDSCVYLFSGQETLEIAAAEAESRGVVLELVHYIPEQDLYFCTSAANLMQVIN